MMIFIEPFQTRTEGDAHSAAPSTTAFLFFVGFFESSIRSSIRDVHATMSRACESLVGLTVSAPAAGVLAVHASAEKSHANATRCVECSRVRTRHRTYCSASYFIIETSNWIASGTRNPRR